MITTLKLNLAKKLKEDKEFRKQFFRLRIKDEIASSIIELRKKRAMRQVDLAKHADMKQSAISRIEQADYSGYYQTLLRIAEALDSRLHVGFEPMEDVIRQYEEKEASTDNPKAICPKCKCSKIAISYCSGELDEEPFYSIVDCPREEHLAKYCTDCGFQWLEECDDNNP